MKKLNKIFIIFVFMLFIICSISKVYSYTLEEVEQIIDLKTVDEDGEPDDYDILIDGEDLIDAEKLPCIETSIDDVLYAEDGLLNIDFFKVNENDNGEKWETISQLVGNFFRVSLYISAGAMLTLLLYIAVFIVISSINGKKDKLPMGAIFNKKDVKTELQHKELINQWGKAVVSLALCLFVMNFIVSFSNVMTDVANTYTDKLDKDSIIVYVKNSQLKNGATWSKGSRDVLHWPVDTGTITNNFGTSNNETGSTDHKGIDIEVSTGTDVHAAQAGTVTQAGEAGTSGICVTIDHGNGYVTKYMYNSKVLVSVGDKVSKGQTIAKSGNTGSSTKAHCHFQIEKDGKAVDPASFKYENAPSEIGGDTTINVATSGSNANSISYYFKTDIEGLFFIQSQYNWDDFKGQNVVNMGCGFIVTLFKNFLYIIFAVRSFFVAVISIIIPIIILIDAFMKVSGNKGILTNVVKVYLYFVFLRPVISIIYYVLAKTNMYLVSENPFYILFVILVIIAGVVFSIKGLKRSLGVVKQKSKK